MATYEPVQRGARESRKETPSVACSTARNACRRCDVETGLLWMERQLTDREQQILELVSVGQSAKEIALEIDIAPRTVERHIENVRLKLSARNRAHLITKAAVMGLLTIAPRPQPRQVSFC
nr:helix-turn-helix transcriptional regulator [Sphingopyxis sp. YR583]